MLSDEYYIMHLTPHGWVDGTEKTAKGAKERPVPDDAVFSLTFHETIRGLLSQKEQWEEVEHRIDRTFDMLKILFATFGKIPELLNLWNVNYLNYISLPLFDGLLIILKSDEM